jgi:hypothetical protein
MYLMHIGKKTPSTAEPQVAEYSQGQTTPFFANAYNPPTRVLVGTWVIFGAFWPKPCLVRRVRFGPYAVFFRYLA